MNVKQSCILAALLLAGCAKKQLSPQNDNLVSSSNAEEESVKESPWVAEGDYSVFIRKAANHYDIDEKLIKAIIKVESGGDPQAVSRSNAIGLMQLKAAAAGRDIYRYKGRYGQPTVSELKDPAINIDFGTAYLNILQNQHLAGIKNPLTMRYAMIVSYVNGAGAMLRTFSIDRKGAIDKINRMTPEQFYRHIQQKHPEPQAPRYLWKVNNVYLAFLRGSPAAESFQLGQVDYQKMDSPDFR